MIKNIPLERNYWKKIVGKETTHSVSRLVHNAVSVTDAMKNWMRYGKMTMNEEVVRTYSKASANAKEEQRQL
jgi:hypothetical protein